jgi:hypothetical protein
MPGQMAWKPCRQKRPGRFLCGKFRSYCAKTRMIVFAGIIEELYSMTHSALPPEVKHARGLEPGGIRLSIDLEEWRDIINDLQDAFEQV